MPAPWTAGAQARIIGEIHGQQTVNVMHFATNSAIFDEGALDTLLLQLAEALLECTIDTLLPAVTIDWKVVRCDAKRVYPVVSDPIVATAPAGSVGELGVTSVSFASTLYHVRTGGGGRRGRGRNFLPPAGEAQIVNSAIDAPTLALISAFLVCVAGKFMGDAATTDWRLGVLSRKNLSGVGGNFDNSFRPATSLNPVANCAVMGTRKVGRGA